MTEPFQNPQLCAVADDAAAYVLGLLDPQAAKAVEARLRSGCAWCQAEAAAASAGVADLASVLPVTPVAPPARVRARLMSYVTGAKETGRDMRVVRGGEEGWTDGLVQGVKVKQLEGSHTMLLRLEPGVSLPPHEHTRGAEQCFIVEGTATAAGVFMQAGDFVSMTQGSYHEEFVGGRSGCVLLISYR